MPFRCLRFATCLLVPIVAILSCSTGRCEVAPVISVRGGHDAAVQQVLYSPDGSTIVSLGRDGAVIFWNAQTGMEIRHWRPARSVPTRITYSPDGSMVAVDQSMGSQYRIDTFLTVLDGHTGTVRAELSERGNFLTVTDSAWSPDSRSIAISQHTSPTTIWDVDKGTVKMTLPRATSGASSVAYLQNGSLITTFDNPSRPPLAWNPVTGSQTSYAPAALLPKDLSTLNLLAASPQGELVLADENEQDLTDQSGKDIPAGLVLSTTPIFYDPSIDNIVRCKSFDGELTDVAWMADGVHVIAVNRDKIVVLSSYDGSRTSTLSVPATPTTISPSPDGQNVAIGEPDGTVEVRSLDSTARVWVAPGHTSGIVNIGVTPDNNSLVTTHTDGTIAVWNLNTGSLVKAVRMSGEQIDAAALSPDGTTLATSEGPQTLTIGLLQSGNAINDVRLWSVPSLRQLATIPSDDPFTPWSALAFSPGGTLLAGIRRENGQHAAGMAAGYSGAMVWSARNGRIVRALDNLNPYLEALTFSPDGGELVIGSSNEFDTFDTSSFSTPPTQHMDYGDYTGLVFTPDGKNIIAGTLAGDVRFHRIDDDVRKSEYDKVGEDPASKLVVGIGAISGMTLSPDADTVATGGADGVVRLWDLDTGFLCGTLPMQDDPVKALAYANNGMLISATDDGLIKIWDPSKQRLRATMTLLPFDPESKSLDWISWTPEGYFVSSKEALSYVNWRLGDETLDTTEAARWRDPAQVKELLTKS